MQVRPGARGAEGGALGPRGGQPCGHMLSRFGAFDVVRAGNLAAVFWSPHRREPSAARLVTLPSVRGPRAPRVHTARPGLRHEPPSLPQSCHFCQPWPQWFGASWSAGSARCACTGGGAVDCQPPAEVPPSPVPLWKWVRCQHLEVRKSPLPFAHLGSRFSSQLFWEVLGTCWPPPAPQDFSSSEMDMSQADVPG